MSRSASADSSTNLPIDEIVAMLATSDRQRVFRLLLAPALTRLENSDRRGEGSETADARRDVALQAKQLVQAQYAARVTTSSLAAQLNVSPRTLLRAYKRAWQTTVAADLKQVRLYRAVDLILHSDLKIESVASDVGLKSKKNLYRLVRCAFNVTPGQLRSASTNTSDVTPHSP